MTVLQARALFTMVHDASLPSAHYLETKSAIAELRKMAIGPFCRNEPCTEAGIHRNARGYLVCEKCFKEKR